LKALVGDKNGTNRSGWMDQFGYKRYGKDGMCECAEKDEHSTYSDSYPFNPNFSQLNILESAKQLQMIYCIIA
jgi:hypothetical protein